MQATPLLTAASTPWPTAVRILDFTISAPRLEKKEVAPQRVAAEELREIPGTAGDPLRALQNLPGIASAGDFVSGLYARGGGPLDNIHLIDRMPLPFPFHFGGLISTLNPHTLDSVNLYPGGFTSEYGESTAAVLDVETKVPRADRWGGAGEINMVFSEGLVEGPLPWKGWSLSGAGRRSYFDLLVSKIADTGFTAFPKFGDYQFQLTQKGGRGRLDFLAFGSVDKLALLIKKDDALNYSGVKTEEFAYENRGQTLGARWRLEGERAVLDLSLARSADHFAFKGFGLTDFEAEWNFWSTRQDYQLNFPGGWGLEAGAESRWTFFPFSGRFSAITDEEQNQVQSRLLNELEVNHESRSFLQQAYLQGRLPGWHEAFSLRAGARVSWLDATGQFLAQPRAAWSLETGRDWKLFGSAGLYARSPDPWLVDPELGGNPDLVFEEARALSLGGEKTWPLWSFRAEAYGKRLDKIVQAGNYPTFYENGGLGRGGGLELLVRRDLSQRWWGWLAYTYSRAERSRGGGGAYFPYDYDQPHMATLILAGRWGRLIRLGAKIRYASGNPYTPALGYDQAANLVIPGERNSARLSPYFRADLRLEMREVKSRSTFSLFLELLNVTKRKNLQGYVYNVPERRAEPIYQIPFIPYLGLSLEL